MKKVLLLGDSIRMGYQHYVKELLCDEYEVIFADDNGRFAAYTLWQVNQMFKQHEDIALVHWNNGYWDMNIEPPMTEPIHPVDEYVGFLRRIAAFIRARGAKIIFATTTPILSKEAAHRMPDVQRDTHYDNAWVTTYNDAATALMRELDIPVNDLYTLCTEDPFCYKCGDLLHLSEQGSRRCATQVAERIRSELA